MRSAQLTTSPSGVAGAGRDQEWLAIPSRVSCAEVERREGHRRAPGRVVEPALDEGVERVLAGVPARTVAAVVAERDRLGERDVEPHGPRDAAGDLGDLEGVREAGALVVLGEDEHLGLAGEPPERARVQDAVAVALEAGPPRVRAARRPRVDPRRPRASRRPASVAASRSSRTLRSTPRTSSAWPATP